MGFASSTSVPSGERYPDLPQAKGGPEVRRAPGCRRHHRRPHSAPACYIGPSQAWPGPTRMGRTLRTKPRCSAPPRPAMHGPTLRPRHCSTDRSAPTIPLLHYRLQSAGRAGPLTAAGRAEGRPCGVPCGVPPAGPSGVGGSSRRRGRLEFTSWQQQLGLVI